MHHSGCRSVCRVELALHIDHRIMFQRLSQESRYKKVELVVQEPVMMFVRELKQVRSQDHDIPHLAAYCLLKRAL